MNYLKFAGVAVLGLVLGLLVGKAYSPTLGAVTVTPGNAADLQVLTNEFQALANPLGSIVQTSTAAIDFGNLTNASGSVSQSTTTAPGIAAAANDEVLCNANTPTAGAAFFCTVSTASTTSATIQVNELDVNGASVDATSTTFSITVLPNASFKAPTGL